MTERTPLKRALLIVDHGSRVALANESVGELAELVARAGQYDLVLGAHMELAEPSIAQSVERCVAEGVQELTVVPYMLAPGRHAMEDIPRLVEEAAAAHPTLACRVSGPLGVHPLLAELVLVRAQE